MLSNIYIENIAVIEKASIDFNTDFNVLTGETGAGKSIIIDSINAIMGHRVSRDLIRSGADKAMVSAAFTDVSDKTAAAFEELGYESEDGEFIISRQMTAAGKNTCRINGRPAPLATLKAVSTRLINIYGQNEGYDFMTADSHIGYIDAMGGYGKLLDDYREKYHRYTSLKRKLNSLNDNIRDRERRIDMLRYQVDEINAADLEDGELEELESQRRMLKNSGKILEGLGFACSELSGDEEEGLISRLDNVNDTLSEVAELYSDAAELSQRFQSSFLEMQDCAYELRSLLDSTDADPQQLADVEDRLDLIHSLQRKYGSTIKEILDYGEKSETELNSLVDFDANKERVEKECAEAFEQVQSAARAITKERTACAKKFCADAMEQMRYLDMPNIVMVPSITACECNENGADSLELLISANLGEEPKPISKIASGGELSRMMLAIKSIIADKDEIDTLIFDEVDTGISGSAAGKVGLKLKELSRGHQVLCVTHQAQIAALADTHFFISKNAVDGRTYTTVRQLTFDERKYELSRIIDGENPSELALSHAEEMLRAAGGNNL